MRNILLSSLFLFFISLCLVQAQDAYTLRIDAQPTNIMDSKLVLILLEYTQDTITYKGEKHAVTPPEALSSSKKAFGFLSFQGNTDPALPSEVLLLLDGYEGYQTHLFVDKNMNFDLSDDGAPYVLQDSLDKVSIYLSSTSMTKPFYKADLQFIRYPTNKHKEMAARMKAEDNPSFRDNKFIDPTYWLTETPKMQLIFDALLGSDSVKLGLADGNLNGLYNDKGVDKILVGDYQQQHISDKPGKGNYMLEENVILEIEGKYYELLAIEPRGKYIKLRPASKQDYEVHNKGLLTKGSEVSDFEFATFDGRTTSLHDELATDKFTLIDVWGTWCKGCLIQTERLQKLNQLYPDKLRILGLNYEKDTQEAKDYVAKHKVVWSQGIADKAICEKLLVDRFPFYILVDQKRKIQGLGMNLDEVEEFLKEN